MDTVTGKREGVPTLQDLLDAVPADRTVACLPTHESLILHDGEKELGRIPLDGVTDVSLLVDSSVKRRPRMGLFLLLGPLAFLFMKKTIREAYRLCIQWKDPKGDYHFTYIRIARRIMADHMLNTIQHSLIPEVRTELARQAPEARKRAAISEKEQHSPPQRPHRLSPVGTAGWSSGKPTCRPVASARCAAEGSMSLQTGIACEMSALIIFDQDQAY
jgi:hypothetical protein